MKRDPIVTRCLVACYPPAWRQRYGDEYAALLADSLIPASWLRRPVLIADALRGALDARLREKGAVMTDRVRAPVASVVWAFGLFTVAGIGFQKMTEDPAMAATAERHPAVTWSVRVLAAAAVIALLALAVAALPTAVAVLRRRPAGTLKPLAVPPVALAVWVGLLPVAYRLADHHGVHSVPNIVAALLVALTGLGVVAATAWSASTVLRRVPAVAPPRLRAVTLTITAGAMAVATVAGAAWGLSLRAADPAGFTSYRGVLATPLVPGWIVTVALMAATATVAGFASRREWAGGATSADPCAG
jgi:hypothetical protein